MEKITINNWNEFGNYMLFANMVDETGKWILLEVTGSSINATGNMEALQAFSELLRARNIPFTFDIKLPNNQTT